MSDNKRKYLKRKSLKRSVVIGTLTCANGKVITIKRVDTLGGHKIYAPAQNDEGVWYLKELSFATTAAKAWDSARYISKMNKKTQRTFDPWHHLSGKERKHVIGVLDLDHFAMTRREEKKAAA